MKKKVLDVVLTLILIAIVLGWAAGARGDGPVLREDFVGVGGLICDTAEQLEQFIALREADEGVEAAMEGVPGCGILVRPARLKMVFEREYLTDTMVYVFVRFEFLDLPFPVQYGVAGQKKRDQGA